MRPTVSPVDDPQWRHERARRAAAAAHAKRAKIEYHVAAIERRADELSPEQRRRLRSAMLAATDRPVPPEQ